jgi:DNA polymerase-3 subunit alpha
MNKEKGTRFGFVTLEDLTGTCEVICWASRPSQNGRPPQKGWADWEHFFKADEPVVVQGEVKINNREEENPRAELTAIEVQPLAQLRNQKTSEVAIRIDADRLSRERAADLKALLGRFPGGCAVTVRAVIPAQSETRLSVPMKIQPSDELIESARRLGFEVELR